MWHPRFIKMKYLTEVWMHTLSVSFFMRVIEECWDPESVVRPTFSEIIVRLNRIFANCSNHGWWKDTFKLPWECLKFIPHEKFSFAKIWLLAAQFEIRQLNLKGARLILGNAIGKAPKDKIFKKYIEIELQLGNIDRCRKLYEKYLECAPENCYAWSKYAELERSLTETERARSIFELAIAQPALDMPELWN